MFSMSVALAKEKKEEKDLENLSKDNGAVRFQIDNLREYFLMFRISLRKNIFSYFDYYPIKKAFDYLSLSPFICILVWS